jgi:hypothetical protein
MMPAGDTKLMSDTIRKDRIGTYALTDNWQVVFFSDTFASIISTTANPTSATYTLVSGGNFAANYPLANEAITRSGAAIKFDADDIGQIAKNASNPAIKTAGLINATNSNDLLQVWDMTSDGSTAVDTVNNDFTFNFGAGGINTLTNTSA